MNNLVGQSILHYKINEQIGQGGMGVVYKAEDSKLKREVAIKFLPRFISSDKEEKQRFEIEAQAAAALNHPNIATIFAIEQEDEKIFIVMEYINGAELKDKIKKGPIELEESQNIIEQIAEGLNVAHKKGIIHRDIKSANIMISQSGHVKIMDFGLAKVGGTTQITRLGTTLGTTAYMSPEQARGEQVDARTDIWSMGVIFYEILTGRLPFKGDFDQAVIYSILNEDQDSIISLKEELPIELDHLIKKMLSKDPELRFRNMEEFLKEFKQVKIKKGIVKDSVEKTIAVLPFENISPDKDADYFADGLAEELIINLSRIKEVNVVARTNTVQYKETKKDIKTIGRELGVRYVMLGSVRKFKDDLRISVQLIEVVKGIQIWGETYKGKLADIFDIQEKVSKEIVDALMLKLSPVEKIELTKRATLNAEAFDYYLKARNFLSNRTKNNIDFAILLFQKAVELDSRFAAAYAGLGEAYAIIYRDFDRKESWLDKAMDVSLKALMYDASLSEAYASLSLAYFGKNDLDNALTSSKRAIELDPANINAYWILSRIYQSTGKDSEATIVLEKVISINPNFFMAYDDLELCCLRLNDTEKYYKTLDTIIKTVPKYLAQHPEDTYRRMSYAVTLAKLKRFDEAKLEGEKALDLSPNDAIMMYYGANLYAYLDEKDKAVRLLKDAIENGYENFDWIKRDPDFDNIRNEIGYIELIRGK